MWIRRWTLPDCTSSWISDMSKLPALPAENSFANNEAESAGTYATTCMYSLNLSRNLVRLSGFSRVIIFVISSTVFAGRWILRLLEGGEGKKMLRMELRLKSESSMQLNWFALLSLSKHRLLFVWFIAARWPDNWVKLKGLKACWNMARYNDLRVKGALICVFYICSQWVQVQRISSD